MFAAVDVFYDDNRNSARAACVLFRDPCSDVVVEEAIATVSPIAPYAPGEFYRRELPCIEAIFRPKLASIDVLLIDGYVYLSQDKKPGLGWHVHQRLCVPVIGIAKTRFKDAAQFAHLVYRGGSKQPLYVTQVGYQASAANLVAQMHGVYRMPTLLRRADQLARGRVCGERQVVRVILPRA